MLTLFERVILGEDAAILEMIEAYTPLALNLSGYPWNRNEELKAQALYALTKAVNLAKDDFTGSEPVFLVSYLKYRIKNDLADFQSRNHMIRVPLSTLKKKARENKIVDLPQVSRYGVHPPPDEIEPYDRTEDILSDICEEDIDSTILKLRMTGKSLSAIGNELGKSRQWVFCQLKKLKRRYLQSL